MDMGGVIISIRKRDYERLDRNIILKIYNEVSMSEDNFLTATKKYNSMQNNLR